MNILKRMSIKKNIMALYIATTLITFGVVYYVLFAKHGEIEPPARRFRANRAL